MPAWSRRECLGSRGGMLLSVANGTYTSKPRLKFWHEAQYCLVTDRRLFYFACNDSSLAALPASGIAFIDLFLEFAARAGVIVI